MVNYDPAAERFFDAPGLTLDPDEEERRRLARLSGATLPGDFAPSAAPLRVDEIPLGAPQPNPYTATAANALQFDTSNLLDELGRPRLSPDVIAGFTRNVNPLPEQEVFDAKLADAYVAALTALNAQPPNQAILAQAQPPPEAAGRVQANDAFVRALQEAAGVGRGEVTPEGTILRQGQPEGRVTAESFLDQTGRPAADLAASAPTGAPAAAPAVTFPTAVPEGGLFGGDLIDAILNNRAQPVGQTDPNPEGITWPILGEVFDELERPYTVVQTGAGDYLVWDPRTEQYYPAGDLRRFRSRR